MQVKKQKSYEENQSQAVVIHINLKRGTIILLSLMIVAITVFGYLALGRDTVQASPQLALEAGETGLRRYYITLDQTYGGDDADGWDGYGAGVCDSGFHFASLWEIMDTSTLEYDTSRGSWTSDSGFGPPAYDNGWVRTGYLSDNSSTPGKANCNGWDSTSGYGTYAHLNYDHTSSKPMLLWHTAVMVCSNSMAVWCVED